MLSTSLYPVLFSFLLSHTIAAQSSSHTSPTKFPWIRKFASIGDSYAAGLGAGPRIDFVCSRYGYSYPNLLHNSYLGDDPNRTHQFLACTGAKSGEILQNQVPMLENGIDFLTISAGGNDIGLTPILNNCIYQFYLAGENDCVTAIQDARKKVADETELYYNITELINAAKPKMNETHGIIHVTGYAGFFGTEDNLCDNVTWAVWRDMESEKQYLKLDLRKQLDEMVRSVNKVLQKATDDAGPNVHFIDYNEHIKKGRGRYCEAGVQEPAPNRLGLNFYEWDTLDPEDDPSQLSRTGDDVPRGSFEGGIAERVNKTLQEHPDWEFDADKGFVNKSKMRPEGIIDDAIWWMLPDSWKRVFHPRPEAHAIIAQLVINELEMHSQERRDSIELLAWFAVGGLILIVGLLLLLLFLRRRERTASWQPAWLRQREEALSNDSDEDTLADPRDTPTSNKNYNTFG